MFRLSHRRKAVIGLITAFALAGAAYAYWTTGGSGSGSGSTANGVSNLTPKQTTVLSPMYPGDSAQTISGNFDNSNSGPAYVGTVTASLSGVTKATDAPAGTCDTSDFTLANAAMTVGAQIPVGTGVGSFTGATIKFNNKTGTNQDACKNATVTLSYAIS